MATIEEVRGGFKGAEERLEKAEEGLKKFMEVGNLERYKELWGIEGLRKEKERLEKEVEKWGNEVVKWGEVLREFGKGEGNEQIA